MEASRKLMEFEADFSYNTDYKTQYEELTWRLKKGYEASPFKDRTFADVFLCAMALGYIKDKFVPFTGKRSSGGIPASVSVLKDRGQILIMSVAIAREGSLDVLFDGPKVYSIAENYANGGFPYLLNLVVAKENIGTPIVRMENLLREEMKKALERRPKVEDHAKEIEMTPFEMIEDLEDSLRKLVAEKMGEISDNWMKTRLPTGLLDEWKKRDASGNRKVLKPKEMPLINRSHLGELAAIILRKDNWREKFKPIFDDEKLLETQIALLVPIRNQIMHSNSQYLTSKQTKTLEAGYEILMAMIKPEN